MTKNKLHCSVKEVGNTPDETIKDRSEHVPDDSIVAANAVSDEQLALTAELEALKLTLAESEARNKHCFSYNTSLMIEIDAVKRERDLLKDKLKKNKISSDTLDNKKCMFYTGVPTIQLFAFILSLVQNFIKPMKSLSKADQVLVTLMKIRLGLKNADLAYRFHVCASTISQVINNCILVLATRMRFMIHWPTVFEVRKNLPKVFRRKKYSNCIVIIDCTEIFTERPYNLSARAKTWSNYKHHHTLKFLVGITPYGAVSFLSSCFGGRVSDKEITARSGFYDKLRHGDMVMADRGFTIQAELAKKGATLEIPPFIAGQNQLAGKTVRGDRRLSNLSIHVERAI